MTNFVESAEQTPFCTCDVNAEKCGVHAAVGVFVASFNDPEHLIAFARRIGCKILKYRESSKKQKPKGKRSGKPLPKLLRARVAIVSPIGEECGIDLSSPIKRDSSHVKIGFEFTLTAPNLVAAREMGVELNQKPTKFFEA